jgi:hypothetical protein
MAKERLEEIVEPYEEAPEEVEERYVFTWLFGFVAVILVLIGAGLIVDQLTVITGGVLKFQFFGFVGACLGFIVCGLTLFDTYWNDRYLVFTIGLLMAVGFALWGILTSPPPEQGGFSNIVKGIALLFVALMIVGIVGVINVFGWVRLKQHKYSAFTLLVLFNLIFLVVAAWIAVELG